MAKDANKNPKTTEPQPQPSKPTVLAQDNQNPPLNSKTWVLKVSVDCEGCKRKVNKILSRTAGVYATEIDLKQQKVTVIGNVDAQTLIARLLKAGKHAELLWPVKADNKEIKQSNKDKDNQKEDPVNRQQDVDQKENKTVKTEEVVIQEPSKLSSENGGSSQSDTVESPVCNVTDSGGSTGKTGDEVKEEKPEVEQPVTSPTSRRSPAADKKELRETEGSAEKNSGVSGREGKISEEGAYSSDAPTSTGSQSQSQGSVTYYANYSPKHYPVHENTSHYYAPPHEYVVNYSTVQPSTSYGASVYPPPYSSVYMHPEVGASEPPSFNFDSYSSQLPDSLEIFSDENPNACSLM